MSRIVPALCMIGFAMPAAAQTTAPVEKTVDVGGVVPPICKLGDADDQTGAFAMGQMADPATGLLRSGMTPPVRILRDSFCNSASEIRITAEVLRVSGSTRAAPTGYSRSVDFAASATGWTDVPATFRTDADTQPASVQRQSSPRAADIRITLTDFHTTGGDELRPIASNAYRGSVIVSLTPVP